MKICEQCGNEHDGSYGSGRFCSDSCRRRFCVLKRKTPYKKPVNFGRSKSPFGTWRCSVCNKIFETKALLYDHRHNEHNLYFKRGQWNKGLTKTTDVRLMQQSKNCQGGHLLLKENRVENGPLNKRKQCLKAEKIIINSIQKNILRDYWQIIDRI